MASGFLDRRRVIALLVLVAALPVLLVPITGMTDLPNHLARYRIFEAAGGGGPIDTWFAVRWRWVGNLGVDLPVYALARLLGTEWAARIVVALIAPLTLVGTVMLSRAAHGRVVASAAVAMTLIFAHPWYYGFVNYCLSVGMALIVGAIWVARPPARILPALGFGLAAIAVWTAHLGGWAILLMIVAGAEMGAWRGWRALLPRIFAGAPLLLPLVPLLAWRNAGGGRLFTWGPAPVIEKVMAFVTMLTGIDRTFDLATTAVLVALALLALLWAGGRRIEPRLAWGAAIVGLATLAVPTNVMESWGTDLRMAPVAVMLAILSIGPAKDARRERIVAAAGLALFGLRVGATTMVWGARAQLLSARLALLDHVPRGSRLGYVSAETQCRTPWPIRPDHALAAYAVVRRDAFVNTLFHNAGADLVWPKRAGDAAHWTAMSQDVAARCPMAQVDPVAVEARMEALAADGFDRIWLTGVASFPAPAGFRRISGTGQDTLYARVR